MSALTLLCFPYAGGASVIFRGWDDALPSWVKVRPVDLPGHGKRRSEPVISEWPGLIASLLRQEGRIAEAPYAIFGHSMGALIALELAHALREKGGREPAWLGLAACRAPARREVSPNWLHCPEEEVLAELRSLGGTPDEFLENRELLDLTLPLVRSDFHLCGTHRRPRREPLGCPISVFGGTADEDVSNPRSNLTTWQEETSGPCFLTMIEGDHFFIETRRTETLTAIRRSLSDLRTAMELIDG